MKSLLKTGVCSFLCIAVLTIFGTLMPWPCLGAEKISSVTIEGDEINGITRVSMRPDGRVTVIWGTSGGQYRAEKFPQGFLSSWGITLEKLEAAKQEDFEKGIRLGKFRVVGEGVYDLRQKQPAWTYFQNARLFQKLESGAALVDPNPDPLSLAVVHVLNLPDTISDTERFGFAAKQVGTFEYVNKTGNSVVS